MLADKQQLSNLTLQLTYFQADTGEIRTFFRKETALDLSSFLNELIDLYLDWIKKIDLDKGHRNRSITTGEFPYPSRRIGQTRMMEEVYNTISSSGQILLQAPTGTGKTIAAIYPTLRALAEGQMEQVFYLTARTTGQIIAEKTLKELREGLPDRPGIYRMYRSSGDILYVGKAKSLKRRVNSYFQSRGRHAEHILEMLSQAKNLTFTLTPTALEAAILEADEIKQLSPPFNRALQKKDRKITYASSDLMSFRFLKSSRMHPEGPFTSQQHIAPMGILAHFLSGNSVRINTRIMGKILEFSRAYLPNLSTFRKGVQAFQSEYRRMIPETLDLPVIKTLGSLFWKEKIAEKAADPDLKEEPEEAGNEANIDSDIWTPEHVVKALKSIIRHGSFQIRRAQWLLRLSEATLLWSDKEGPQTKHILIIEKGKVHYPSPPAAGDKIPVPTSHTSSLRERRTEFDLATYDRLRVLNSEIRRLVDEGRLVELRLHPGVQLNQEKLKKMLPLEKKCEKTLS